MQSQSHGHRVSIRVMRLNAPRLHMAHAGKFSAGCMVLRPILQCASGSAALQVQASMYGLRGVEDMPPLPQYRMAQEAEKPWMSLHTSAELEHGERR